MAQRPEGGTGPGWPTVVRCVAGFADENGDRVCIVHGRPIIPLESCGGDR